VLARRGVGDAVPTRRKSGRSVWATAPRGHARAPPANAMNSRRLIVTTPNATIVSVQMSVLKGVAMSALPLKADMCSAQAHVGYGPKADMHLQHLKNI